MAVEGLRASLTHRTPNSGLRMAAAVDHVLEADGELDPAMTADEHWARLTVSSDLAPGQRLALTKFVAYGWSGERSDITLKDQVDAALTAAVETGWAGLLAAQRDYLDAYWARADVEVDGDDRVQQAVRFGMFHLLQASARAEQRAIPAKGLTGTGYAGHAFWETESFVLPVLTATIPAAAADALRWRRATLSVATEWANDPTAARRRIRLADDRRRGVQQLLAGGHGRVPRQRRHRRRGGPAGALDRGRRLRP